MALFATTTKLNNYTKEDFFNRIREISDNINTSENPKCSQKLALFAITKNDTIIQDMISAIAHVKYLITNDVAS